MQSQEVERIDIESNEDVVRVRRAVRTAAASIGFGHTDQVRLVTAASELARNIQLHAGKGAVEIRLIENASRRGVQIVFDDQGGGIPDVGRAMSDGFTSGGGLGKGLPGARRLVDDFEIESEVGRGTSVRIAKWLGTRKVKSEE